jgi:acyl carrier protein
MNVQIEPAVRQFVREKLLFGDGTKSLNDETSFLESGIIDSTGVLELVLFLEGKFSIRVADEEVVPENLDSISRIAKYVTTKLNSSNNTK